MAQVVVDLHKKARRALLLAGSARCSEEALATAVFSLLSSLLYASGVVRASLGYEAKGLGFGESLDDKVVLYQNLVVSEWRRGRGASALINVWSDACCQEVLWGYWERDVGALLLAAGGLRLHERAEGKFKSELVAARRQVAGFLAQSEA